MNFFSIQTFDPDQKMLAKGSELPSANIVSSISIQIQPDDRSEPIADLFRLALFGANVLHAVTALFNRVRAISSRLTLILVNDTSARDVILEQVESIALRKELI